MILLIFLVLVPIISHNVSNNLPSEKKLCSLIVKVNASITPYILLQTSF